jgi:hypothetical protein
VRERRGANDSDINIDIDIDIDSDIDCRQRLGAEERRIGDNNIHSDIDSSSNSLHCQP